MPTVSGSVLYATGRFGGISGTTGIPTIPVVIQDRTTGKGIVVLTDASGDYTVLNVTAGNYRIVEAYGTTGGVASPANFATASVIPEPTPKDPPLASIGSPIANTNQVDSLSPNTRLVTVSATNLGNQDFTDSSVLNTPLNLPSGITLGNTLLTGAGNGIWGTLPNGTAVNSIPPSYPYTGTTTGLNYMSSGIINFANDYSMTNINTLRWFFAPNHTTFDETSRYIVVNGGNPNAILFRETVNVSPNSYYLAGAWLIMITNAPNTCLIGFRALASDGVTQLFYGETSNIAFGQWGQIGQIFNTQNNSQITLQVLTMSTVGAGNDFALDDVSLQQVDFGQSTTLTKSVDKDVAGLGDTIVYSSVIRTSDTILSIIFQDTIPTGATFVPGTVQINGTTYGSYNPQTGFTLPNIGPNGVSTVVFNVLAVSVPSDSTLRNVSRLSYNTSPIPGNTVSNVIFSDTVPTVLEYARLNNSKSVSESYGTLGDTLTFTITIANAGNITANNVLLIDTIPSNTEFVTDSVYIDGVNVTGVSPAPPTGITLNPLPGGALTTINFNVHVVTVPTLNPIRNSAVINYEYTPAGLPLITTSTITNSTATTISFSSISAQKLVDKNFADIGDILTYFIPITNSGNVTAMNVLLTDTIPNGTSYISGTLKQDGVTVIGVTSLITATLPINIPSNETSTITFQVKIVTIPSPNPIPNIANISSIYTIDSTTVPLRSGYSYANTNYVYTEVNTASLGNISKSVDKTYATCGDTLTYTITLPNSGNTTAFNVILTDTIPSGTTFINSSVIVNGIGQPGQNPSIGITVGTLPAGTTAVVKFSVLVNC